MTAPILPSLAPVVADGPTVAREDRSFERTLDRVDPTIARHGDVERRREPEGRTDRGREPEARAARRGDDAERTPVERDHRDADRRVDDSDGGRVRSGRDEAGDDEMRVADDPGPVETRADEPARPVEDETGPDAGSDGEPVPAEAPLGDDLTQTVIAAAGLADTALPSTPSGETEATEGDLASLLGLTTAVDAEPGTESPVEDSGPSVSRTSSSTEPPGPVMAEESEATEPAELSVEEPVVETPTAEVPAADLDSEMAALDLAGTGEFAEDVAESPTASSESPIDTTEPTGTNEATETTEGAEGADPTGSTGESGADADGGDGSGEAGQQGRAHDHRSRSMMAADDGTGPSPVAGPNPTTNDPQPAVERTDTGVAAAAPAGNAAATSSGPTSPSPTTVASTVQRIIEVVEEIARQTPPRSMTVELSELDGIRVQVSMENGGVRLRFLDDLPQDQRRLLEREIERSLTDRGLDLRQDGDGRRRGDHDQSEPRWVPLDSGRVLRPSSSPHHTTDTERGVRL